MKKLILFFFCLISLAAPASAATTQDAENFAKGLADDILAKVVRVKAPLSQKQDAFHKIFITAIDTKTSARFTLGRYARSATPEQMQSYTDALVNNIIYTWTARFEAYAGEEINFTSSRQSEKGDFYITSKIAIPNSENDAEIIWRVTDKKDTLKLADLIVEGVSMLMSYRGEYTTVLQQNGGDIDALIKLLQDKNKSLKNPQ